MYALSKLRLTTILIDAGTVTVWTPRCVPVDSPWRCRKTSSR